MIPDFVDHVTQLCLGISVALEVRAENAVRTFRETAGPWNIEVAKVSFSGFYYAFLVFIWVCCGVYIYNFIGSNNIYSVCMYIIYNLNVILPNLSHS